MPSPPAKDNHPADTPDIAFYKEFRAASRSWFEKIMRQPACKPFDIHRAARKVGLVVHDRTIVFDDENESAVLMDYFLRDYRQGGKSIAENCRFAPGELTPMEARFHEAFLASRTSLFAVAGVHDTEPRIQLLDRLEPQTAEFWLTDIGLAASIRRTKGHPLMFTRVISAGNLHCTGGFSFVFDPEHEFALLDGYRREMWSVPARLRDHRRTGYFLARYRRFGLPQIFADVEPAKERGRHD